MAETGRPAYTDDQYKAWLQDLEPFLKKGNSIYYACNRAGLGSQYWTVLEKYKLGDWFSKKIDAYRAYPGELINDTLATLCMTIAEKVKSGVPCTKDELDTLKFMAEKHRTAQPFFVTRQETAVADETKVGKILDTIETDYDDVRQQAQKQMVAVDPLIQDKG